ncbi:MAG: Type secretion system protein [Pseudomonadota bacterium]
MPSRSARAFYSLDTVQQRLELGNIKDPEANDQHFVSIVDWLLQYTFDQCASDSPLEPRSEKENVRFKTNGGLTMRSSGGEEIELRLSTWTVAVGEDLACWPTIIGHRYSVVISTEPTRCGKTTTTQHRTRKQLATDNVIPMMQTLQRCVGIRSDLPKLRQQAGKQGLHRLRLSGAKKVAAMLTTVSDVLRVVGVGDS